MVSEQRIRLEDLYGTQREIAELIGVENYIKLSVHFGGDNIYIQKYSEVNEKRLSGIAFLLTRLSRGVT